MKSTNPLTGLSSTGQPQHPMPTKIPPEQAIAAHLRPLPQFAPSGTPPKKSIRHILLGEPEAIRQTIHLLHTLHYTETILWTPVLSIEEPLIIAPAQSEAISLLRKQL